MRVAVIGAGISGLVTAYYLEKSGIDVTLFEASERVGGNIYTVKTGDFLLETGPNSLLGNREIFELIDDLGISAEILRPGLGAKKRYIVRDGRLVALPASALDILTTRAFSLGGRLRLLKEPFIPRISMNGESVAAFFERRVGREITDFAVDPFVSGIYAGDPKRLSIKSAFPKLFNYEKDKGSITRGALVSRKEKRSKLPKGSPRSFTFKDGMITLTGTLHDKLKDSVRLTTPVLSLTKRGDGYVTETAAGEELFDSVVISTPSDAASSLVSELNASVAATLADVYYPPLAVVYVAFNKKDVGSCADGFGALVPSKEKRRILGFLFSSAVFAGRAPETQHLFTVFIGGSRNADLCSKPNEDLIKIAVEEVADLLKIPAEPTFTSIKKWGRSIPQYNIGYERIPEAIEQLRVSHPRIFFCSNFYNGISVGDCVKNGMAMAQEIVKFAKAGS